MSPERRHTACAVEMHFKISQEPPACAVEMHVKISQEPLYTEIYRKKARDQSEHPDQAPAFTATVRTPQCGHTVWGKMGDDGTLGIYCNGECSQQDGD